MIEKQLLSHNTVQVMSHGQNAESAPSTRTPVAPQAFAMTEG